MIWNNPEYFMLLLIIPLVISVQLYRYFKGNQTSLIFSSTTYIKNLPGNWRVYGIWLAPLLYWSAVTLVVLALARPQIENTTVERQAEGIDIMLSLDVSSSMLAEDLKPNRMIAAKDVAANFIETRFSDRIGLAVFARQSFTVVPPTLDHTLLKDLLSTVDIGMVQDGTAIGMGIATAINRLRESEAESKVLILLTDGMNNAGEIDPVTAAELARAYGIRIYAIGMGTRGTAPYPIDDPIFGRRYQNVRVEIDDDMLTHLAEMTGGLYFRAESTEQFERIYKEIDSLEQTVVEEIIYTDREDLYPLFLLPAILCLLMGLISEKILFRPSLF